MNARTFAATAAAIWTLLALPLQSAAAHAPRVHVVQQLLLDQKPVQSASGVTVTAGTAVRHILQVGEIVADGTRIDVPPHLVVTIVSSGDRSTTTLEPGASVTFVSTGSGELLSSNKGTSRFNVVPHTLDFFRVQSGEALTASVHGTEFSVNVANHSVTYNCTRGEVNVTKTGYLLIGQLPVRASFIDVISAASRPEIAYHPTVTWYLGKFQNFGDAEKYYRDQLDAAVLSGDANAINAARLNLGNVQRLRGRYADALNESSAALAFYRHAGDKDRAASAIEAIGLIEYDRERPVEALALFQQALTAFEELNDLRGEADSLKNIGDIETNRNQFAEALRTQQKSLALYRRLGDEDGEARTLANIGIAVDGEGRHDDALVYMGQALPLFVAVGDRDGEAAAYQQIGVVQLDAQRYAKALPPLRRALVIYRDIGDPGREGYALFNIGTVQEKQGNYEAPPSRCSKASLCSASSAAAASIVRSWKWESSKRTKDIT